MRIDITADSSALFAGGTPVKLCDLRGTCGKFGVMVCIATPIFTQVAISNDLDTLRHADFSDAAILPSLTQGVQLIDFGSGRSRIILSPYADVLYSFPDPAQKLEVTIFPRGDSIEDDSELTTCQEAL
jgi:hypothetical protein